jgi:hypothetical protein
MQTPFFFWKPALHCMIDPGVNTVTIIMQRAGTKKITNLARVFGYLFVQFAGRSDDVARVNESTERGRTSRTDDAGSVAKEEVGRAVGNVEGARRRALDFGVAFPTLKSGGKGSSQRMGFIHHERTRDKGLTRLPGDRVT